MATVTKRCGCARGHDDPQGKRAVWNKCSHSWVVRWQDQTGRTRETSYPPHERREADAKAKVVESEKITRVGMDPSKGRQHAVDYIAQWIEDRPGAESTRRAYRGILSQWIAPALGRKAIANVSRDDVRALFRAARKHVGDARQAQIWVTLCGPLSQAVRDRALLESPMDAVPMPVASTIKDFIVPTPEQYRVLEDAMPADWRLAIRIMRTCGLRPGEALAVSAGSVRGERLRVSEQLLTRPTDTMGPLKHRRAGEWRDVPLPDSLRREIVAHTKTADGHLFQGRRTLYPVRETFSYHFERARDQAGLPSVFTLQWLRHAFVSVLLSEGQPITDVSEWLGHRSIQTTYEVYGHMLPNAWDRAREIMGRHLSG